MDKIIFLDIDGVLNCQQWYKKEDCLSEDRWVRNFDPYLVSNLNKITNVTGAKIVLSSTWRRGESLESLKELFSKVGITGELVGKTPYFRHEKARIPRGEEVRYWLEKNGYKHNYRDYVIIDDDSDFLYNQRANLFLTDTEFGLGSNCAYRIINFLNKHFDEIIPNVK